MKLIDLLTAGRQVKTIPKSEIPGLIGEIESLKARLWVRLTEWEELEPVVVLAKSSAKRFRTSEIINKSFLADRIPVSRGRIMRTREVVELLGLSRSTIWRMERNGQFPKHRSMGPRSVGWLDTEVQEWIGTRQCGKT